MPSFLLRRGELLHPSDLVEQLWDEVLRGEGKDRNTCGDSEWQICTSETFTWRGRGSLWAGEWRRTVFYLSRFKTVNQQILQNREKQDEITAVCSHLSCSETGAHVCPTLTLAARSTSLGMSSSSSTSISSSGMASSYSTCNKRRREAEHHQRPNIHQASL